MKGLAIYSITGNPFVDTGIAVMMSYCKRQRPEDISIEDIIKIKKLISEIYLSPAWSKNLYTIFPNNEITNPSNKTKEIKREKWESFLNNLINNTTEQDIKGNCISCGRRDSYRFFSKTYIPLTGSGSLRNYFSYAIDGAEYCSACAFAVQAAPLAFYNCGKLMLLIHSSNFNVVVGWSKICLREINKQISLNNYTGCFSEGYTNPINALFHIANRCIDEYENEIEDGTEITIYHFTNYNQEPGLNIYRLPAKIFTFLKHLRYLPNYREWLRIVKKGYNLESFKKVDTENEETYKNYNNTVYTRLLKGESILRYFFVGGKREVIGDFHMLSLYLEEVLGMDRDRIEVIKKVADKIAEHIKRTNNIKRLTKLEMSKTLYEFRNQLRLITKEKLAMKDEEPLLTIDEYVDYLFPDGTWRDTQDLIIFRIYESLFDWLKEKNIEEITDELDKEDEQ